MQTYFSGWLKSGWLKAGWLNAGCFKVVIVIVCVSFAFPAFAQQTASPPSQDEINKQLLERIQELEKEIQQIKAQPPVTLPPPPAPEPAAAVEAPTVNEVAPRLKLNVFGDVGAQVFNHVPSTFEFGSLDLFMTARLSDKVSTLGEVLFLAESDNSIGVDVERLFLKYRQSDYFVATFGRYHTWVGYYNTAFNKGEFLETTVDRPFVYAFDDQGGVLPMQDIGINVTGKIPSGKMGLNYVVEVGNGRAWGLNSEPTQNNQDATNSKSINGGLFIRPDKISGLQMGFSIRHDNLSVPGPSVGETIATVHAVFINSKYEILNEGALVRHVVPVGPAFNTSAFYSQISRAFHDFRPYFRYQYFNAASGDPVYRYAIQNTYAPLDVTAFVGRLNGPSAGIRWDFTQHSAVKVQYDRYSLRGLATENGLTTQIAFTF
jgi:hypothetical protein